MKKIFCLLSLLMAFNVHAGNLDLAAVVSGNTKDSVCYLYTISGDTRNSMTLNCAGKAGSSGLSEIKKFTLTLITDFVESGRWNLAATFVGGNNVTVFVFTKK